MAKASRSSNGRRGGSYAQMQQVLDSQEAVNEQVTRTMASLSQLSDMVTNYLGATAPPVYGPGYGPGGASNSNGGAPGRPIMTSSQSRQNYNTTPTLGASDSFGHGPGGLYGVRRHLTGMLNSHFGAPSGSTYQRVTDAQGNHVGYVERTPDGSTIHRPTWGVSDADLAGQGRRAATSSVLGGLEAGGLVGAARSIPYVGAAVMGAEAVKEGLTFVSNQRAANAQYQSIYNGSNISGLGQRFDQLGFQMGQMFGGGLTWGQSQEAFQGVSALGYQGNQRNQDLSFITKNYMDMGVSVSDSLKLITTAAGDLNQSLTGLQQGLQQTRAAAAATGQNANVGTQIMQSTYQGLSNAGYAGGGVGTVSGAIAQVQAGMGRYMSNIPLGQILQDPNMLYRMAASQGMTMTQFQQAVESGRVGTVFRGIDSRLAAGAVPLIGDTQAMTEVRKLVSQMGQGSYRTGLASIQNSADPTDQLQRITDVLKQRGLVNAPSLQAAMKIQTGQNLTYDQSIMMALREGLGINQRSIQHAERNSAPTPNPQAAFHTQSYQGGYMGASSGTRTTINAANTGVNPVVDALSKKYSDDTPIIVQDGAHGGSRVVTLGVAKQYYTDQLALGKAKVANTGASVTEAVGMSAQRRFYYSDYYKQRYSNANEYDNTLSQNTMNHAVTTDSAGGSSDARGGKQGESVSAYRADQLKQATQAAKNGKVVISPSPELARLLSFSAEGNAYIAGQVASTGSIQKPGS